MPTKRYKDIGHRKRVTDRFSRKIVEDKMAEVERGDRPTTDSIGIMSVFVADRPRVAGLTARFPSC